MVSRACQSPPLVLLPLVLAALLCCCHVAGQAEAAYHKPNITRLDQSKYPSAKCLDGSPGAFYYAPASAASNNTKWVFSLEGGGECVHESDCTARASTRFGSSKAYTQYQGLGELQYPGASKNPDMSTYNFVFIKYCSGDLFSGAQKAPSPASWGLQFSGHEIVRATLHTLIADHALASADLIVWSGDSAGGMGCMLSLDFVADLVHKHNPDTRVLGAPIAGYYFSNDQPYNGTSPAAVKYIPWTFAALQQYYTTWSAVVPARCRKATPAAPWKCLIGVAILPTLATPVFIMEAQTDRVVMPLHDGLPHVWYDKVHPVCRNTVADCPESVLKYMSRWRQQMMTALIGSAEKLPSTVGFFHPSCLVHTEFKWEGPFLSGMNYLQAFGLWAFRREASQTVRLYDTCGVMCNPSCVW
jgi:hypothetical protein